ncbi:MAG: oligosaccharide flippase family protein [Pseudomonadota bacterium]
MTPPKPKSKTLRSRVTFGAAVMLTGALLVRMLDILSLVVLARLLAPADYGVVALAMVFVGIVEMASNLRLSTALIRKETITESEFDTAFTLSMLRGLLAGGILFASAQPLAQALGEPIVAELLHVLAVVPVLNGLINQRFVVYEKRLDFSKGVSREVLAKIMGVIATIGLALVWQSYWALVIGTVVTRAGVLVLSYTLLPAWPRLGLTGWREFVAFGGWLAGARAVARLSTSLDTLIVGLAFTPTVVGQYNVGNRMATSFTGELVTPLTRSVYSGLASIARDTARMREAYYKAQSTILGVVLPVGVGAALLAHELILVLIGPQWLQAVTVVQVVAPVLAFGMVSAGTHGLVMVDGSTRRLFVRSLVSLGIRLPCLLVGLWLGGFLGLLIGRAFANLQMTMVNLHIASTILKEPFIRPLVAAWRTFLACGVMAAAILLVAQRLGGPASTLGEALIGVAVKGATGAAVYVTALFVLWLLAGRPDGFERRLLDFVGRLREMLRHRLRRR